MLPSVRASKSEEEDSEQPRMDNIEDVLGKIMGTNIDPELKHYFAEEEFL